MKVRNMFNDGDLVLRISMGDERAFKQVYDYYFPKIRAFSGRILHDDGQAQEVAQDVLMAFWKKGYGLRQLRNPEAFLKTLCKRHTIDTLRKNIATQAAERAAMESWNDNTDETVERMASNDLQQVLKAGVALLPPQQRKAYLLCHQQGMRYKEAARQMDISPGTVQSHMKRALRFMRGFLNQHLSMALAWVLFA